MSKDTKTQKMRFTLMFQVEYEADPEGYTDPNPVKMAEEDTASAESDTMTALRAMMVQPGAKFRVKCEAIQTTGEKAGLEVVD